MTDILTLGVLLWFKKFTMNVGLCELLGSLSIKNWLVLFWIKESGEIFWVSGQPGIPEEGESLFGEGFKELSAPRVLSPESQVGMDT